LDSTNSSVWLGPWGAAASAAVQAGFLTAAACGAALWLWRGPAARDAAWGLGCSWLLATVSTAALLAARPVSRRVFWWAFWGGMALRFTVLAGLMALCLRSDGVSAPALLLGYALGVTFLLPLEFRQVPLR